MGRLGNNPLFGASTGDTVNQENKEEKAGKGRPRNPELVRGRSVQEGLTEDYTRATFIVRRDLLEKMKDYAYTERLSLKDVVNTALDDFLRDKDNLLQHK